MGQDTRTIKEALALLRRAWREARPFFLSIELLLMVVVAFATVGGLFLAFMGSALCLLPFGFALAYLGGRTVLHCKRIVAWPFL